MTLIEAAWPPPPAPAPSLPGAGRAGVYGWIHREGGVGHFRIVQPLEAFAASQAQLYRPAVAHGGDLTHDHLDRFDTILAHGVHDERRTQVWQELAAVGKHRLVLDVDDAMWWADWAPFREGWQPADLDRLYANVTVAHVITTPSPVIAEYLSRWNPNVHVVPNTVPAWLCDWTMPERVAPVIGFQGSDSHLRDWTSGAQKQLSRFLDHHPEWHLHTYGGHAAADPTGTGRVHHTPWTNSVETYWRTVSLDIGIGPLRDTRFNRAKSDLRAREYAALGIVAVLPDLPLYRGTVIDGVTGRLVQSHQTLSRVLAEVAGGELARMGQAARAVARLNFTTEGNIERWVEAWMSV
jgi:hypothetical protein